MTRFNTGNQIGSNDPRDRDDNSKNLDVFMHTEEDEYENRFGIKQKSMKLIQGEVQGLLIAGGKIFETEAQGRAAAEDGQYFFAESDDPDVSKTLYQRVSESESRWIADDPSADFVRGALTTARNSLEFLRETFVSEFYTSDEYSPLLSMTDQEGRGLSEWDREGFAVTPVRKEFFTSDDAPFFAIRSEDERNLYAVDENLHPIVEFAAEFYTSDDTPATCWVDKNFYVYQSLDDEGNPLTGGANFNSVAIEPFSAYPAEPYWHYGALKKTFPSTDLSTGNVSSLTQPHTKQYDFYNQLMDENPDYITREKLGESTNGADIYAYTFDSISNLTSGISLFAVPPPIEIVITSGLHGNERTAQAITMMVVDGFVNRWRENPVFNRLRWQCRVRIIPCCNPDGIDAGTRRNTNNVDINRNHPTDWDSSADFSGPSAGSETETQVLMTIPALYPDSTAFIDMHTHAGTGYIQWLLATNQADGNLIVESAREMVGYQVYGVDGDPLPPLLGDVPPGGMIRHFVLGEGGNSGFIHETGDNNFGGDTIKQRQFGMYGALDLINRVINREVNFRMGGSL